MSFAELNRVLQRGVRAETDLAQIREKIDALEAQVTTDISALRAALFVAEAKLKGLERNISYTLGVVSSEPGETVPLPLREVAAPCGEPETRTSSEEPRRPGRPVGYRDLAKRGSRLREDGQREFRYSSSNYVTGAKLIGVGTIETKHKRRLVWLTEAEIGRVVAALRPAQLRYQQNRKQKRANAQQEATREA